MFLIALNGAMWWFFAGKRAEAKARTAETTVIVTNRPILRAAPAVVVRTNAFQWEQLESEDYRTYINRLRSIGCPEETIRDIVIADLQKLMAPRVQAINGPHEAPKYWKAERKDLVRTLDSLEKLNKKQGVDFEEREIVRDLLGIDLAAERSHQKGETDFYEERLNFLPAEKLSRVRMAIEQANQEEVVLREKSWLENDELTPDEKNQLQEIQQKKDDAIAGLLTPSELDQYDLWFSPSAYRVRAALSSIDGSENDFLAIYRLQRGLDAKWPDVDVNSLTPEQKQQYQQAQSDFEKQAREYLGTDRYEKFVQGQDPDFQQLQAAVAQFALKPEVASEVYDFKKTLQEERARVQQNVNLSGPQKDGLLHALSEEAERAVLESMGPKPYRYYMRAGAGKWIWGNQP
ncbi:MAG TPA: hypothetical protein VGR78_16340 [Verrucomicrobiae bacterium]|nr:hypothetical protein [Verrucomicrobiae bacterium]